MLQFQKRWNFSDVTDKRKKVPPGLDQASLIKIISEACIKRGVDEKTRQALLEYVDKQVTIMDGRAYLKKGRYHGLEDLIYKEFNGRNLKEIMEKFKIGRSTIYRIIKKYREAKKK